MNKPLQKLRRFFARPKKFNATANPDALSAAYDEDDGASRLSGAFVIVLLLHIVALAGVFAFARIKDSRSQKSGTVAAANGTGGEKSSTTTPKNTPAKQPQAAPAAPAATPAPGPIATVNQNVKAAMVAPLETKISETKAPAKGMYIVKGGDNLTKIAAAHHVTITDIVKANTGMKIQDELKVGQEIRIPEVTKTAARSTNESTTKATAEEKSSGATYTVKKGDNLYKISTSLGVKYDEMVKLNKIKDPKKLQEGQKLKVPAKG